jgi:ubiquinone/menaquinone biosynthesis C-methylase UbiE
MNRADAFDTAEFKEKMRTEWRSAAAGWRRWHDVVEATEGGKLLSAKLVQLAGIGPGDSVLDVAGGYGEPSLAAARVVGPNGRVVCTDISGEMLAFGQERAAQAGLDNVAFVERDAEQLDFEDESFDAVLSRSGLMFLPDVAGTLKRLHSFLKVGGSLAASVWGPQPAVQMTAAIPIIFAELKLPPPPPGRPGIFALADPAKLAALVADAGFHDVETGMIRVVFETDTPEQFTEFGRDIAPMITELVDDKPPDVQERVWSKVTEAWKRFQDADGRVRTENQAIWVVGTK